MYSVLRYTITGPLSRFCIANTIITMSVAIGFIVVNSCIGTSYNILLSYWLSADQLGLSRTDLLLRKGINDETQIVMRPFNATC